MVLACLGFTFIASSASFIKQIFTNAIECYMIIENQLKMKLKHNLYHYIYIIIIKFLRYTEGDYVFVPVRTPLSAPPPLAPDFVNAIRFEQLVGFPSFLANLLALTYTLPDHILVTVRRNLGIEYPWSEMEFAMSPPKMIRFPWNEKQTNRINSRTQMWPSGLALAMALTLIFSMSNMKFAICQPKMVRLPWNGNQTYQLKSMPYM